MAGIKGRSGSGGKREGSGRQKGVPNKSTAEIKEAARKHGAAAIDRLAHLMMKAESEAAQVAAAKEILDRAYGKAPQAMTGEDGEGPIKHILEVVWAGSSASSAGAHLKN